MKNGSSSSSSAAAAANAGGNSLAITERQKPAPSCVAALFQMLAKRRLFSSSSKKNKLLPPVRAQKFSPGRAPGGGGKTPVAKMRPLLLDSADYARSKSEGHGTNRLPPPSQDNNCSEMCNPGVVARLMGLSSMPAISHQRPTRAMDSSELGDHQNECSQGYPGTSHQKQQKPGQLIGERHDNASEFNTDAQALWSRRHPHKVASPLKSPRSISSGNKARLIEAAVRVLEPGLQSRNRHPARRHACLEYSCNGDGVASAAVVLHDLPDQYSRDMCDGDAPMSASRGVGATSLHNSTSSQWFEENGKKNATVRRPNQNVSWQVQPEGNSKVLHVSSFSEKARFKDSVQMISNATADTYQDVRKIQPRNISWGNVPCIPLKQNNQKQNALPAASKAADPGHMVQGQKQRTGEQNVAKEKDFVSLNKSINSSTSLRSKAKAMDRIGVSGISAENKTLSTKGRRTSGVRSDSSNKLKLRTATPKAMEKDMIIAKGAGLVSEKPVSASPNCSRNDLRRQVELRNASRCNDSGIVSFTFSSPMKAVPTSLPSDNTKGTGSAVLGSSNGTYPKRYSRRDCQNISSQKELVFREALQGTSSLEAAESASFNRDELKNIDIPGGRVTSSLLEKISAFPVVEKSSSDELLWQCKLVDRLIYGFGELPNPVELHETHKKHEADAKASNPSQSIPRGNNQRRPVSILQSTYADDDCISGSPHYTAEANFKDSHSLETSTPSLISMQDVTTERNSRCLEPNSGQNGVHPFVHAAQDGKLMHPGEVTSTVELLLTNVCSSGLQKPRAPSKAFLLQIYESALATLTTSAKNNIFKPNEANPLRDLAFEFIMEGLDSMCVQLCDSGYRSFSKLAMICTEERLAAEVKKEIARCGAMAGKALDDLAVSDVETGIGSLLHEAFQIGAQIERDLLQELVNETGLDMLKRL